MCCGSTRRSRRCCAHLDIGDSDHEVPAARVLFNVRENIAYGQLDDTRNLGGSTHCEGLAAGCLAIGKHSAVEPISVLVYQAAYPLAIQFVGAILRSKHLIKVKWLLVLSIPLLLDSCILNDPTGSFVKIGDGFHPHDDTAAGKHGALRRLHSHVSNADTCPHVHVCSSCNKRILNITQSNSNLSG